MSEEEKDAIEYYKNYSGQVELEFEMKESNWEELKRYLGITEENSYENHRIRVTHLLNLIKTQNKMIDYMIKKYIECPLTNETDFTCDECDEKNKGTCDEIIKYFIRNKAKESK